MNALSKLPEQEPAAPTSLKTALIERIRAGGPIEEQREVYQFLREIAADESKLAFAAARPALQAELPEIPKRGRIDFGKGKPQSYPLWEDTNELIKPVLSKHGFVLDFDVQQQPNTVIVTACLTHEFGFSKQVTMGFPIDTSGTKSPVQAIGSTTSYGKRYTAGALLNLTSRGEDDDGVGVGKNGNGGPKSSDEFFVDEQQVAEIKRLLNDDDGRIARFCKTEKIGQVSNIPASRYNDVVNKIIEVNKKIEEKRNATGQ